jgi:hypothetical protein
MMELPQPVASSSEDRKGPRVWKEGDPCPICFTKYTKTARLNKHLKRIHLLELKEVKKRKKYKLKALSKNLAGTKIRKHHETKPTKPHGERATRKVQEFQPDPSRNYGHANEQQMGVWHNNCPGHDTGYGLVHESVQPIDLHNGQGICECFGCPSHGKSGPRFGK